MYYVCITFFHHPRRWSFNVADIHVFLCARGYGFGGYLRVGNENGAQLLGDFSRPPDLVETLTLRGLVAGLVERFGIEPFSDFSAK